MFLNTLVIDTYMENKEVWVVVLVLGFVLLLNSNSFTGNAYVEDREFNRLNSEVGSTNYQTIRNANPPMQYPKVLSYNPYATPRQIAYAQGSDYYSGPESREGLVTSPQQYGISGYGQAPLAIEDYYSGSPTGTQFPSSADPNRLLRYPSQGIDEQRPYVRGR